jgi:hypothetical protein
VKPDGDVYIGCRDNYKELKISLHGNRWRVGLSEDGAKANADVPRNQENRAWMVWDRPAPVEGITLGYRIFFFPSELSILPSDRPSSKWRGVTFIPAAPPNSVTLALVTLNEPGRTFDLLNTNYYRDFLPLPNGGQLQLTIQALNLDEEFRKSLMIGYRRAIMLGLELGVKVPSTTRIFLTGSSDDGGWPFSTEVNLVRPDPDPLLLLEE